MFRNTAMQFVVQEANLSEMGWMEMWELTMDMMNVLHEEMEQGYFKGY